MRATTLSAGLVTVLVAAFLATPAIVSILAGLSRSYAQGISGGLTLDGVFEVWRLYADTIFRSIGALMAPSDPPPTRQ